MSRPRSSPSPLRLACVLLALATPALASREDMLRSLNGADAAHAQQVLDGVGAGCVTYQLAFPEECCPSSYTRVRSTHARPAHQHRARDPPARRRQAAPTLDPALPGARHHPSLRKRRLDWLAPLNLLQNPLHSASMDVPPPSPTRTASSTASPRPNADRHATYAPRATAAPVADPGRVELYAVDDGGCRIETVYRQGVCPSGGGSERALGESREVLQLEMWKEEGRGKRVLVECGRVGTFYY